MLFKNFFNRNSTFHYDHCFFWFNSSIESMNIKLDFFKNFYSMRNDKRIEVNAECNFSEFTHFHLKHTDIDRSFFDCILP